MDINWKELIIAVPWGAVIVILRWMDIKAEAAKQQERDNNAKEKSLHDRENAQLIAKSYADAINSLARSVVDNTARTEEAIREFRDVVLEQYDNMKITQSLLDIARKELVRKGKSAGARN